MRYAVLVAVGVLVSGCASLATSQDYANKLASVALEDAKHALEIAKANGDRPGEICLQQIVDGATFIQNSAQGAQGVLVAIEVARVFKRDATPLDCGQFFALK